MSGHDWDSEWPEPLTGLLGRAKDLVITRLHELMRERGFEGVRPGHGCVFRFIDPGGSRLTDLAARSGFTKQAVGEAVTELESLGYVERVQGPVDRRVKIIRLTARGAAAQAEAGRIFGEIEQEWADELGAERVAALRETLQDIADMTRPNTGSSTAE